MNWDSVWKWVAGISSGAFFGLLLGNYTPNRNIVTTDQLNQHIQTEASALTDIKTELGNINDYVNQQKGADLARKEMSNTERRDNPK